MKPKYLILALTLALVAGCTTNATSQTTQSNTLQETEKPAAIAPSPFMFMELF